MRPRPQFTSQDVAKDMPTRVLFGAVGQLGCTGKCLVRAPGSDTQTSDQLFTFVISFVAGVSINWVDATVIGKHPPEKDQESERRQADCC